MASETNTNKLKFSDVGFIILAIFPLLNSIAFNRMSKVCNKKKNTILRFVALILPVVLFVCIFVFSEIHEEPQPVVGMPVIEDYINYTMDRESEEYKAAYNDYQKELREWKINPANIEKLEKYEKNLAEAEARNETAESLEVASVVIMMLSYPVFIVIAFMEFSNYRKALLNQRTTETIKTRIPFSTPVAPYGQPTAAPVNVQNLFPPQNTVSSDATTSVPKTETVNDTIQENNSNKININTATELQITTLPGLTIIDAKKAIAYRDQNGKFASTDEFFDVIGAKPHIIVKISELIYVEGGPSKTVQSVKRHIDL